MLTFDLNVTMEILVVNSAIQGFAVGVVWVPITVVAFGTLDPKHYAEASAIFHLLRNIGSSFFISLSIAEIVRTTGANYSRMTEMITPYDRVAGDARRDRRLDVRQRAGPRARRQGDRAPGGDDRLSQRLHDVHGGLGRSRSCSRCWSGPQDGVRSQFPRHCEREAKQSIFATAKKDGLLRRFAPRNDGERAAPSPPAYGSPTSPYPFTSYCLAEMIPNLHQHGDAFGVAGLGDRHLFRSRAELPAITVAQHRDHDALRAIGVNLELGSRHFDQFGFGLDRLAHDGGFPRYGLI